MTEEELRAFLTERKGKPEDTQKIIDGLSAKEVQAFAVQFGKPAPDEARAEEIAKQNRAHFAETIKIHEAGGVPWDLVKDKLN